MIQLLEIRMGGTPFMLLACECISLYHDHLLSHVLDEKHTQSYRKDHLPIVKYLIKHANPMAGNQDGWSSLHIAAL